LYHLFISKDYIYIRTRLISSWTSHCIYYIYIYIRILAKHFRLEWMMKNNVWHLYIYPRDINPSKAPITNKLHQIQEPTRTLLNRIAPIPIRLFLEDQGLIKKPKDLRNNFFSSKQNTLNQLKSQTTMSTSRQFTPYSITVEQAALVHSTSTTSSSQLSPPQSNSPMDTTGTLPDAHAPTSSVLDNPNTTSTQTTDNPLIHLLASTPIHIYPPPQAEIPTPTFRHGRDRFPTRPTRFHAPSTCNPHQYEILPGPLPNFDKHWSSGRARRINDSVILAI